MTTIEYPLGGVSLHAHLGLPTNLDDRYVSELQGPIVDIHTCLLDATDDDFAISLQNMSAQERDRTAKLVFPEHQRRFARSHHALRQILAGYCNVPIHELTISFGVYGRPHMSLTEAALDFSFSHSGRWAVVAVSSQSLVGIDIECLAEMDSANLPLGVLTSTERLALKTHRTIDKQLTFFDYWTAKESFMKLNGLGLQLQPESIEIVWNVDGSGRATTDNTRAELRTLAMSSANLTRLFLTDQLAGCLASKHLPTKINYYRWGW